MARVFRVGLIQLMVSTNKNDNLHRIHKFVREAAQQGAKLISLPECFNSPYGTKFFKAYSETVPGTTTQVLSDIAKENKVYLVGGSIPEVADGKLFNTCTVFDPEGSMIAKYRKMHLFDIDVPGKITFRESDVLSPGNEFATFDTPYCKVGLGICYDVRFPELAQAYCKRGCQLVIYPGAFNTTTGPVHWELLQRSRALDNQIYVATCSPARDKTADYITWGHSTVVDPWGRVMSTCDEKEQIVYADIDLNYLDEVRSQIPVTAQKRYDIYDGVFKSSNN
ncbi:Omega-amidase NIT2 [Trichoplax sp. H2]|uniref:omega-amidase n=1 Tax=Trichoplax adhaerens TaxID=10228 RepID=B3RTR0_TRIAD|nr:hypothetical protein TRIADDRAFT_56014 [Trichoplax adhaerens]EDV26176.1 hypothetical protein TRIADDRAFT_56014 [Trichoplax adhaerens]RDD44536.1 Omega-amidase NIT2 [Trichoplax sp. H2]|eukprot:XP_002112209.1 hypothetical protein TRIADDRAFT_56014 [Trichoplax adhaerens]